MLPSLRELTRQAHGDYIRPAGAKALVRWWPPTGYEEYGPEVVCLEDRQSLLGIIARQAARRHDMAFLLRIGDRRSR